MRLPKLCQLQLFCCSIILLVAFAISISAQEGSVAPRAEIKGTFGYSDFGIDEESYPHFVAGSSLRVYVTRRISLEPEFLYMRRSSVDDDFLFQQNVAYDFLDPGKRFVPYVIGGVGVLHHRGRYNGFDFDTGQPRVFDTSGHTWSASGGVGAKIFVTKRLFVAPELRLGVEPTFRAQASVGYIVVPR
jgi:Outer membrane protein beta-barrel domain